MEKIAFSEIERDRAKHTKIWDHKKSLITNFFKIFIKKFKMADLTIMLSPLR